MRDFKQYLEIVRHHIVFALSNIGYFFFFGASGEDLFFQLSREAGFLFLLFARSAKKIFESGDCGVKSDKGIMRLGILKPRRPILIGSASGACSDWGWFDPKRNRAQNHVSDSIQRETEHRIMYRIHVSDLQNSFPEFKSLRSRTKRFKCLQIYKKGLQF